MVTLYSACCKMYSNSEYFCLHESWNYIFKYHYWSFSVPAKTISIIIATKMLMSGVGSSVKQKTTSLKQNIRWKKDVFPGLCIELYFRLKERWFYFLSLSCKYNIKYNKQIPSQHNAWYTVRSPLKTEAKMMLRSDEQEGDWIMIVIDVRSQSIVINKGNLSTTVFKALMPRSSYRKPENNT